MSVDERVAEVARGVVIRVLGGSGLTEEQLAKERARALAGDFTYTPQRTVGERARDLVATYAQGGDHRDALSEGKYVTAERVRDEVKQL